MKKANFKYYFSLLTFLLATTGIVISKHYSAGHLFDVAIFGEAESCCMPGCDCCEVEFEYVHVSDSFEVSASENIQIAVLDLLSNFNFHIDLFNTTPNCIARINQKITFCYKKHKFSPPSERTALTQNFLC